MSLTPGARLGPYEIVAPLGAGGMGEVFRARDTTLARDVALKILPDAFASDPERVARFEREARVLAGLNHPHIAAIYGLERQERRDGQEGPPCDALVMELVEGPTLEERLRQPSAIGHQPSGALPISEAVDLARQIADALDAAHEKGIVHRDLKPANIKVRDDGTVKVLDFGLAKAFDPGDTGVSSRSASLSPTLTAATQLGVILGTAAYMSPEQARGKPVDKRADIWAFGAVLYEMLSGRRAFEGDEISDTLAFVITKEPDWSALPPETPPAIHTLLRRCLDKDRKRRLADIADARYELDEAGAPSGAPASSNDERRTASTRTRHLLPWIIAATTTLAALTAIVLWAPWRTAPVRAPMRLSVDVGVNVSIGGSGQSIELSPDGTLLAFIGDGPNGSELYIRRLSQLNATRIEGTRSATTPFFSPDGQWIAYFADSKLKKVSVNGGASNTLTDEPGPRGGAWGEDGSIVFMHGPAPGAAAGAVGQTLYRVSASGGKPEPVTKGADGEITHRWPQLLNGGKAVLYTAGVNVGGYEDAHIVVQQIPNGARKTVVTGGYHGRYVASGHLLYMHAGTLFAMPFDLDRLEPTGSAVPAIEGVGANPGTGAAHFTLSETGTLAYIAGAEFATTSPIVWLDRDGKAEALRSERVNWSNIQFSPDGRRVAFDVRGPQADIWTYEWDRDTARQLTFDAGDDQNPVWSPDGRYIAFASRRPAASPPNLFVQRADGTGDAVRLTESQDAQLPTSWHPSGKFLAYTEFRQGAGQDLMMLPLEGDSASGWRAGKPFPFLATPAVESDLVFSPDGRWVAYTSTESGLPDIYVRPFPGPGGQWKISTVSGARYATWSRVRRELLYRTADPSRLMLVPYSVDGDSFRADKPQLWGEGGFGRPNGGRGYDLHPDGRRVAASGGRREDRQDKAVFVVNFFDELRRIAPSKKP